MPKKVICEKEWTSVSQNWAALIPPERPSKGEIAIYEDYLCKAISKRKACNALLLGATPELRDLLAKYKINTTIVDINPVMVRAMDELLEYSDAKEEVVISNWLDINLKSRQFDVILCDMGLHWIFFEDWDKFFKNKLKLLKKDGYFIMNVVAIQSNEAIENIGKIIDIYKNNVFTREDKFYYHYRAMSGLKDYSRKKYCKDLKDYNNEIEKYFKKGIIDKADYDFLSSPWGDFKPVVPPKEVVDKIISKYFKIKSIRSNFEHPVFTCHKIYFGKARK
jgi:SAM-dependent methyltransferase